MEKNKPALSRLDGEETPPRLWVKPGRVLGGICVLLWVLDFIVHRHSVLPLEKIPGFYLGYGLLAGVVLVWLARQLSRWLRREEDYYDVD